MLDGLVLSKDISADIMMVGEWYGVEPWRWLVDTAFHVGQNRAVHISIVVLL